MSLLGNIAEIKTGIDRFLEIVNTLGEIKVDAAASKLGVSAETIEIWAEILQQDSLIEIGYDGFGKMTVKPMASDPLNGNGKEKKSAQATAAEQKKETPNRGFSILKNIKEKAVWKKKRESKNKNRYLTLLNKSAKTEINTPEENVFSRILKRLGVKHR